MQISEHLKNRLSQIKVQPSKTLFPLSKEDFQRWLPEMRCPTDQKRLYWLRNKTGAICRKCGFFIRDSVLKKYGKIK